MDLWAPCPDWRELQPGTEAACLTCEFYPCEVFERRFVDPSACSQAVNGGDPRARRINELGGNT